MKILHVTNQVTQGGGVAKAVLSLVNEQANDRRLSVALATSRAREDITDPKHRALFSQGVKLLGYTKRVSMSLFFAKWTEGVLRKALYRRGGWTSSGLVGSNLVAFINSCDVDIVHLHWVQDGMFSWADLSNIEKRVVWTLHDYWPCNAPEHTLMRKATVWRWYRKLRTKSLCKMGAHFIAPTEHVKDRFVSLLDWTEEQTASNIRVIPNIYNRKEALVSAGKASNRRYGEVITIGFGAKAYRDDNNKGYIHFCRLARVLSPSKEYCFVLFGDSHAEVDSSSETQVRYYGMVEKREDLDSILQEIDIFCVLSESETFGYTTLEAVDNGCIVAVRETCGLAEVVERFNVGCVLYGEDYEEWAKAMVKAVKCKEDANKRMFLRYFEGKRVVDMHVRLYEDCLGL